jgi:geranylgeranyl pyrophosphate synthase
MNDNFKPLWNPHVSLGEVLQILALIFAISVAWSNLNSRLTTVENQIRANTELIKSLNEGQILQNKALEKLNQRLEDYPLHIHIGHEIRYPNGQTQGIK